MGVNVVGPVLPTHLAIEGGRSGLMLTECWPGRSLLCKLCQRLAARCHRGWNWLYVFVWDCASVIWQPYVGSNCSVWFGW